MSGSLNKKYMKNLMLVETTLFESGSLNYGYDVIDFPFFLLC
jgi:hypothetical protein